MDLNNKALAYCILRLPSESLWLSTMIKPMPHLAIDAGVVTLFLKQP